MYSHHTYLGIYIENVNDFYRKKKMHFVIGAYLSPKIKSQLYDLLIVLFFCTSDNLIFSNEVVASENKVYTVPNF